MEAPVQRGGAAAVDEGIEPLSVGGARAPDREADPKGDGQGFHVPDAN
jgi:hypothetical protein